MRWNTLRRFQSRKSPNGNLRQKLHNEENIIDFRCDSRLNEAVSVYFYIDFSLDFADENRRGETWPLESYSGSINSKSIRVGKR